MNALYNQNSAADAARMLGIHQSTVTSWCRTGKINATNVGDGGDKARWTISDEEVNYIMGLKDKFGSIREAMLRYKKNWKEGKKPAEPKPVPVKYPTPIIRDYIPSNKLPKDESKVTDLTTTISYIQDVKARIADCENELALLKKEYEDLKKEVIDAL